MTLLRLLVLAVVAVVVVAGPGGAAPPSGPPTAATVVVQTPAGSLTPSAGDLRAARATAARLAPGRPQCVRVATGGLDARGLVLAHAAAHPRGVIVGAGPDVRAALAEARAAWPELRAVAVPPGR